LITELVLGKENRKKRHNSEGELFGPVRDESRTNDKCMFLKKRTKIFSKKLTPFFSEHSIFQQVNQISPGFHQPSPKFPQQDPSQQAFTIPA
jgi:hypothetical protein